MLPLWPDPEDPAHAQAAAAAPRERFAFLPLWLSQSWSNGGRLGHWHPGLARRHPATGRPMHPSLLAHFVHVPGGASNKLTVKVPCVGKGTLLMLPLRKLWAACVPARQSRCCAARGLRWCCCCCSRASAPQSSGGYCACK